MVGSIYGNGLAGWLVTTPSSFCVNEGSGVGFSSSQEDGWQRNYCIPHPNFLRGSCHGKSCGQLFSSSLSEWNFLKCFSALPQGTLWGNPFAEEKAKWGPSPWVSLILACLYHDLAAIFCLPPCFSLHTGRWVNKGSNPTRDAPWCLPPANLQLEVTASLRDGPWLWFSSGRLRSCHFPAFPKPSLRCVWCCWGLVLTKVVTLCLGRVTLEGRYGLTWVHISLHINTLHVESKMSRWCT